FSSCHIASRTSSTRSLLVSIERLSIFCSTQVVAMAASRGLRSESRHSGPWPVKRSPGCVGRPVPSIGISDLHVCAPPRRRIRFRSVLGLVFLLVQEVGPVLALL